MHFSRWLLTLSIILLSGCVRKSDTMSIDLPNSDEITAEEGYELALPIAQEWDEDAYLSKLSVVFQRDGNHFRLERGVYQFVSGDQKYWRHILVFPGSRIEVGREVKLDPGWIPTDPYDPLTSEHDEQSLFEQVWAAEGSNVESQCDRVVKVTSSRKASGHYTYTFWGTEALLATVHYQFDKPYPVDLNDNFCD